MVMMAISKEVALPHVSLPNKKPTEPISERINTL